MNALYDALRRVYGGQVRREPADLTESCDPRPDLALLLEGVLTVFDLKVFAPIGSDGRAWARAGGGAAQGGGVARQQADRVGVRRDDVVGADVHGVHDAAPLGGGAVLGRAGGGRGARPVGGGRPTSGALDGRRGA